MKTKDDLEDNKLEFKGHDKIVELTESDGGHQLAKLELAGRWDDIVKEEEDAVSNENAVRRAHKIS